MSDVLGDYSHLFWTAKDGLPAGPVLALTQDVDGFLWVGGQTGLVRFDGLRFVKWEDIGEPALPSRPVSALAAGPDGSIWVGFGNEGGVSRIRGKTLTHFAAGEGVPPGAVRAILTEADSVWVAAGGLSHFQNEAWHPIGTESGLPALNVDSLYLDSEERLWLGTSSGVFCRDTRDPTFRRMTSPPFTVRGFAEGIDGAIFITHPGRGFQGLDGRTLPAFSSEAPGPANGSRLLRDRKGNLWIGTIGQGLLLAPDSDTPRVERYAKSDGLSGAWIHSLLEDSQGQIWVGTIGGLDLIRESRVKTIARAELNGELVRTLTTDSDGVVWIGTANGLHHTSGSAWGSFRQIDGLPPSGVTALHDDGRGTLWVGSDNQLAYVANGRLLSVPLSSNARIERITAITHDLTGSLWLCDFIRGLFRWDGSRLTLFDHIPGVGPQGCTAAHTDSQGRVWIGFIDGTLLKSDDGAFQTYSTSDGLSGGVIRAIHEDEEGTLWIGAHNGLTRLSDDGFVTLSPREGLPGNGVSGIAQDASGHLWIGMLTGILRLARDEFDRFADDPSYRVRYRLYDVSDGLDGVLLSTGHPSVAVSGDGRVLFVTNAGPVAITPSEIDDARRPPPVHIESSTIDGQPHPLTPDVTLASSTEDISFEFVGVNLATPTSTQFRYMLEGFDSTWVEAGSRRSASYSNLPPRQYRFRVTARAGDGAWNDHEAIWAFEIAPPFYYSYWFLFSCALLTALAMWGGFRLNATRLSRRFAIVTSERTRIAGEIHDTLLQSLLGVSLQFEAVSSRLETTSSTKPLIDTIRRRLELTIRETRNSILNLRDGALELRTLPAALRDAAEGLVAGTSLGFDFSVTGRPRRCEPWLEEQILRVGQEAISNVVRHAKATHLKVVLHYGDSQVVLGVQDDGCGFFLSEFVDVPSTHCGLQTMRERVARAGGHLTLDSAPGKGTSLEVAIPIGRLAVAHD